MLRQLPRSDEAFADEAVLGYALRMAEANRVRGLGGTARLLGCGSVVRGGQAHAASIAQLYGASPSRLIALAPHQLRRDGELHVSLMGCELSKPWMLRSHRPQVCPTCLAVDGYARVDWDVLFMTRCRLHWTPLLDQCPDCKETLCWRRMTLKRCSCGQNLCRIDPGAPTDGVPRWMAAWIANRMDLPAVGGVGPGVAGDLEEFFDGLSVDGALRVLWALGVKRSEHDNVDPGRTHGPIQTAEVEALVLRACARLRQILSDSTSAQEAALAVHVNALVSLAARGLTDQDRRTAAQLVAALGFRSWKNARLRDRSPHAQLELFESPLTCRLGDGP